MVILSQSNKWNRRRAAYKFIPLQSGVKMINASHLFHLCCSAVLFALAVVPFCIVLAETATTPTEGNSDVMMSDDNKLGTPRNNNNNIRTSGQSFGNDGVGSHPDRSLEEDCSVSIQLWDARKNVRIGEVEDNGMIEVCRAKAFTIEAVAPCSTSAIMFLFDGDNVRKQYREDSEAPYMLAGEGADGDVFAVKDLKVLGRYRMTIETSDKATKIFHFTVLNCFDFRFSKVQFIDDASTGLLPLGDEVYPISGHMANILQRNSLAHSVITMTDPELAGVSNINRYLLAAGGIPDYPIGDVNAPFWNEFRHVMNVQIKRRNKVKATSLMKLPKLWARFTVEEVAEAVHDEYPGYWPAQLLAYFWKQGVKLDYSVVPFRSERDFIGYEFRLADLNTWATGVVAPINFRAKWHGGYPRPEEIAWLIAKGEWTTATHKVPVDVVDKIMTMNLQKAEDFTAYPEGCPPHPSWPAMHSAASSASLWMAVVLKLNDEQYCEAVRMDYAVSYARTVAGVHYRPDNIGGLKMGQYIVAEKLADHLADKYGANRDAVQKKIDRVKFDWATYDPKICPKAP